MVDLIREVHGLDLSPFDETFFAQLLCKRQSITSMSTSEQYLDLLEHNASEARTLQESMDVVYSEFFRNSLAFSLLEQTLLPEIFKKKEQSGQGEIRIWSAGCATGQEAWSAAILLDELIGPENRSLSYRIIATDRSQSALSRARIGRYDIETLGNVKSRNLRSAFSRRGDVFDIVPRIRDRVSFSVYDLLDPATICPPESIFGNFDLVFCCNVLFYYKHKIQTLILKKIRRCLAQPGYLITDATERRIVEKNRGFHLTAPPAAVFETR